MKIYKKEMLKKLKEEICRSARGLCITVVLFAPSIAVKITWQ
jgi:hypothetical protein